MGGAEHLKFEGLGELFDNLAERTDERREARFIYPAMGFKNAELRKIHTSFEELALMMEDGSEVTLPSKSPFYSIIRGNETANQKQFVQAISIDTKIGDDVINNGKVRLSKPGFDSDEIMLSFSVRKGVKVTAGQLMDTFRKATEVVNYAWGSMLAGGVE